MEESYTPNGLSSASVLSNISSSSVVKWPKNQWTVWAIYRYRAAATNNDVLSSTVQAGSTPSISYKTHDNHNIVSLYFKDFSDLFTFLFSSFLTDLHVWHISTHWLTDEAFIQKINLFFKADKLNSSAEMNAIDLTFFKLCPLFKFRQRYLNHFGQWQMPRDFGVPQRQLNYKLRSPMVNRLRRLITTSRIASVQKQQGYKDSQQHLRRFYGKSGK